MAVLTSVVALLRALSNFIQPRVKYKLVAELTRFSDKGSLLCDDDCALADEDRSALLRQVAECPIPRLVEVPKVEIIPVSLWEIRLSIDAAFLYNRRNQEISAEHDLSFNVIVEIRL